MGKKNRAKNKQKQQQETIKENGLGKLKPTMKFPVPEDPFVSVCTPTFNRRPFFPYLIKSIEAQEWPIEKMEWIIIDDGTDCIRDLVEHLPYVKYFRFEEKMSLGKKRNLMHEKTRGDVIVYFDDDDYYPPERISHAVDTLRSNKKALIAGSSKLHIYFNHNEKVYSFGPYGPRHSTAGTFAFKRDLLKYTRYEDEKALAEEKTFLKNYEIPLVQMDPMKVILVFSHEHNTFDKRELLEQQSKVVKETTLVPSDFIKDEELRNFYVKEVNNKLKDYEPGEVKNKPDVLKQTAEIRERRNKLKEQYIENEKERLRRQPITLHLNGGEKKVLDNYEATSMIINQSKKIEELKKQIAELEKKLAQQ